jgi:hypothetical protein
VEANPIVVADNAVLNPALKGENMKAILGIFQGKAALVGAPDQAFETTTTTTNSTSTNSTTTTTVKTTTTTNKRTGTTTTTIVVEPDEIVLGDIVPDETIQC